MIVSSKNIMAILGQTKAISSISCPQELSLEDAQPKCTRTGHVESDFFFLPSVFSQFLEMNDAGTS